MTLMDSAQLLGNFGEFFGAIAVVITLIFLTVQLRQNTEMIRAQMSESRSLNARSGNEAIYNSAYLPEIQVKVATNENLTDVEAIRYGAFFRAFNRTQENVYRQYRQGLLEENIPVAVRTAVRDVVGQSEVSRQLWNYVKPGFTDDYVAFVDEAIASPR